MPQCETRSKSSFMRTVRALTRGLINIEPRHISNNVVCATSKASDQPAHMRSLIRRLLSKYHIVGNHVSWKSRVMADITSQDPLSSFNWVVDKSND